MTLPFTINSVVICDDLRREWNGKDILIGVYGGGMKVQVLPMMVLISLWLETNPLTIGEYTASLKVVGQGNSILFEQVLGKLSIATLEPSNAAFAGIPLNLQAEGKIEFQLSIDGGEWQVIKSLYISKGDIAAVPTKS